MAGSFASASTQYLINSTTQIVSTGYPLTVGMWFNPAASGALISLFSFHDTGVSNHYLSGNLTATLTLTSNARAGGTAATGTTAVACSAGAWSFGLWRFISATNRWVALLANTGEASHAQNTTNRAPTSIDTNTIGVQWVALATNQPFNGRIAEYWYTQTDIQADAAQLADATLRQLAYGGPFSVPHVGSNVLEYRSLRKHPTSDADASEEIYYGAIKQAWANTNGVTIGAHPPVPYWYVKPGQTQRVLTI